MRLTALLALALCCEAQISIPRMGFVRDRAGSLRPVQGIAGTFSLGDSVLDGVVSAASSETYALAKTDSELVVLTGTAITARLDAPAGMASFGFDSHGAPNWVRFANSECVLWQSKSEKFEPGACPENSREPEVTETEPLSDGWIVRRTPDALFAVRTTAGNEAIFALPEASQ